MGIRTNGRMSDEDFVDIIERVSQLTVGVLSRFVIYNLERFECIVIIISIMHLLFLLIIQVFLSFNYVMKIGEKTKKKKADREKKTKRKETQRH